jgi:competence protein ComFC
MLKYKGKRSAASDLAKRALVGFEKFISEISKQGSDHFIIVPLPLHKERKRERGYNQSELLAKAFVKISKIKNIEMRNDILIKTKATETQVSRKNKSERTKNLKDCFKVANLKNTQNKNIIILDDIITTGSTLQEAKRALEKAGAKNVSLFAVAH